MIEEDETPHADGAVRGGWLTRGVASVGAASFFSDSGHEIATAILPSFITTVLHSTAAALGIIEGVSDALTGIAKLLAGPAANDPQRRGKMATGGYLGTAVATGAIGLAGTVWQAGVLRALAWTSRGVRSPARDSLLASLAPKDAYGRAFGFERAGDNLGAVAGPLLAAGLVAWVGIRPAIYFAFIPGALAAVAILVAARAARRLPQGPRERARMHLTGLHEAGLFRALIPVALFECSTVARPAGPQRPAPPLPAVRPDGRGLRLRQGVRHARPRRAQARSGGADEHFAGVVAGRLRPLRATVHPHELARSRHLPHRRRRRRARGAALRAAEQLARQREPRQGTQAVVADQAQVRPQALLG